MEPIVNPWLIYLVSIVEHLRNFFNAITFVVCALDILIVMSIIENKYKPELIYSFYNMFKDMHYDRMCIDNVGRQWNRRKKYYKPRKNLYVAF